MADSQLDFLIQAQDTVTVTFSDATTITGDFIRWYPDADGAAFAIAVPADPATIADVTSVYYVDQYIHLQKLTPTTP